MCVCVCVCVCVCTGDSCLQLTNSSSITPFLGVPALESEESSVIPEIDFCRDTAIEDVSMCSHAL